MSPRNLDFFFLLVEFSLLPSPLLMQSLLYSFHFPRYFLFLTSYVLAKFNRFCSLLLPACQLGWPSSDFVHSALTLSSLLAVGSSLATQGSWTCFSPCPTSKPAKTAAVVGMGPGEGAGPHRVFHQGISEQFLPLRLLVELPVVPRMPERRWISWSSYFLPWLSILLGPIECMISLWALLFLVGWGYVASSRSYCIFHTIPLLLNCSKSQSLPCGCGEPWLLGCCLLVPNAPEPIIPFSLASFSQWINLDDLISSPCWSSLNFSRPKFPYFVLPTSLSSLFSLSSVSDTTFEFEKPLMYCLKHI